MPSCIHRNIIKKQVYIYNNIIIRRGKLRTIHQPDLKLKYILISGPNPSRWAFRSVFFSFHPNCPSKTWRWVGQNHGNQLNMEGTKPKWCVDSKFKACMPCWSFGRNNDPFPKFTILFFWMFGGVSFPPDLSLRQLTHEYCGSHLFAAGLGKWRPAAMPCYPSGKRGSKINVFLYQRAKWYRKWRIFHWYVGLGGWHHLACVLNIIEVQEFFWY